MTTNLCTSCCCAEMMLPHLVLLLTQLAAMTPWYSTCLSQSCAAGHTKPVHCCAWNSLLKVVASGSADRRILLFNPFSCRTLGALEGHAAPVVCLASNERDMQLISAAADNTIKVGAAKSARFMLTPGLHGHLEECTHCLQHIQTEHTSKKPQNNPQTMLPQVWDLRNQRCLQTLQLDSSASLLGGHQHPLSVLGFSPAGGRQGGGHHHHHQQQRRRLMVAGSVRLQGWALSDGSGVGVRQGHREAISWVGYVQDLQEVRQCMQDGAPQCVCVCVIAAAGE